MPQRYQIFLSHSSADKPAVETIARKLQEAGLEPFLDKWHLVPGEPWQEALEKALDQSATCAIFFGPGGSGPWHNEEMRTALDQRTRNSTFRVIPVLLPGAPDLPPFLTRLTWVDFRPGLDHPDAFHRLVSGIKGTPPGGVTDPNVARATLDALPIDEVPPPRQLPPGSRMPLPHNPLFVGREEDLKTLARQLKAGQTSAVGQVEVAAATGLGGIGKTQLASELVYRYGQYFAGGVFWMSFADAANIPVEVADCGRGLELLSGFDFLTLEQQVRLVEEAWRSSQPRLLVFDNCEEEELLQRWRPRFGNARVLVTSRRPEWDPVLDVKTIALTTLPRPASIELLRLFRPDVATDEQALDGIASELGDLPLALHLAGSFLKTYRGSPVGQPAAYLECLEKVLLRHPSLQGRGSGISPTRHESDVGRTFSLIFERLDAAKPADTLAECLLARAAWFAPGEPIPRSLLVKTAQRNIEDLDTSLLIEDALLRLTTLGLLEINNQNDLLMHRLVASWAQGMILGNEARIAVEEAILEEAKRLNEIRNPALLLQWQPHLRATTNRAMGRADRTAARLCNEIGIHLWMAGDYSGARSYLERAIAVHEAVSGPEHEGIAHSLNVLGVVLLSMHDFDAAELHLERALAIREKVLGSEIPDTATSLNDLGSLRIQKGDYEGARFYLERALAIQEKVLNKEHPDTARSLGNLGTVLTAQGDLEGARSCHQRSLTILERLLEPEHPDTARSLGNLGAVLNAQGDFGEARSYYQRALTIHEKTLGLEHPDTATDLNNLGLVLLTQGDFEGARSSFDRALTIKEKVLGQEDPGTATILSNLGKLLADQRDLDGARSYCDRALTIQEKVLGMEHPDTAISLNNLGALLNNQGDSKGARSYYERALMIQEKMLGPEHSSTARTMMNLGTLYLNQRNAAKARWYLERAVTILTARLGSGHPYTKEARRNLNMLPGARRLKKKRSKKKY